MCSALFLISKPKNWIPNTCIQSGNCCKCWKTLKFDLFVSDIVSTEKKLEKMCLLFLMIPIVCLTRLTLYIVFYPQNGIWIQNYYSWSQNDGEKWSKNTVWPGPIWIKVKKSWLLLPQHQSSYPRGPEYVSIEIPPFRPHFITFSKTVSY